MTVRVVLADRDLVSVTGRPGPTSTTIGEPSLAGVRYVWLRPAWVLPSVLCRSSTLPSASGLVAIPEPDFQVRRPPFRFAEARPQLGEHF